MQILNQFQYIKLTNDQHVALNKLSEFLGSSERVFILQGYAGTGKTTLIKGIVNYLSETQKEFEVMAPTGRAAKVLRGKTGKGKTIHSSIYNLEAIQTINASSKEAADQSIKYIFPIKLTNSNERILIVDESSMISNKESKQELFDFGSNILLQDLLTYTFSSNKNNKIIFVGDSAQLPPVSDNKSCALDSAFFQELGYTYKIAELTEVKRQENNLILKNATAIRDVLNEKKRTELIFENDGKSVIKLNSIDLIDKYLELFPNPEIGDGVILSYSNAQCYHYNIALRKSLFPNQKDILPGDLILINNNNYHTYATELFNGDIAKVVDVSNTTISQSAPVYVNKGSKQEKKNITLEFRKITIRVPNYDGDINCYIIDSLLNSIDRDLTPDMMKALYINFVIRFNEAQDKRKASGLKPYKVGSEEFKKELKNDPFYNALRVKYGYAITCHKSQGGEWDKVIIDYSGRVGLHDAALRWCYTATTRGINTVYTFNAPHITNLTKLNFSAIANVGNIPNNALNFDDVKISPFHNSTQHKCKSFVFWNILEHFEKTDFKISNVESKGDFLERYFIENSSGDQIIVQASHKGSGHFIDKFKVLNSSNSQDEVALEKIFDSIDYRKIGFKYVPSNSELEKLYSIMQEACEKLNIAITNVEEKINQYHINYFLVTDSISSHIQFYFKKDFRFTSALPKTYEIDTDKKLIKLIEKLSDYAK